MSTGNEPSLLVVGECMMELLSDGNGYRRAFAGDVYNTAVYAKRRQSRIDVQILTAVGDDAVSDAMIAQWDGDGIGHRLVMTSEAAHPGIYAVSTDANGERSFTYWRRQSAATEFMSLMTTDVRSQIAAFTHVYCSGITLAILPEEDKEAFLCLLAELRQAGQTIAFDPNYRAKLWHNSEHAAHWLTRAYRLADIALPGIADHRELYGQQNSEEIMAFLQGLDIQEIVLKAGQDGLFGYQQGNERVQQPVMQDQHPKDTTGAGDSFAGTYLAERMLGLPMTQALQSAAKVARLVIQHRGAIVDAEVYRKELPWPS